MGGKPPSNRSLLYWLGGLAVMAFGPIFIPLWQAAGVGLFLWLGGLLGWFDKDDSK